MFMPKISAISLAVYPSILIISEYIRFKLRIIVPRLQIPKQMFRVFQKNLKKMRFLDYIYIDIMKFLDYNNIQID
jgi:hypothetical protein